MKRWTILLILMFVFVLSVSGAVSATEKVSKNSTGGNAIGESVNPSVSADGRYVAFSSDASNLVSGDTNGISDVFVRDRVTGTNQRVSFKWDGTQIMTGTCSNPVISSNARYVAYESSGDLGWGSGRQVYLYDRVSRSTELVSQSTKLNKANSVSIDPSISADGRYVAFVSYATNLMDPNFEQATVDNNENNDVFVRDRITGITKRVSLTQDGQQALNGNSLNPSISADGRYVAFTSYANNLVSGDTNGYNDIFVRDVWGSTTKRIMGISSGSPEEPNLGSDLPSISADGRYVAFQSEASNLVSGDTNAQGDIFRADMFHSGTPLVTMVSQGNAESGVASISADGRYVAFASYASNLISGDTNGRADEFVRDMVTGKIKRLSVSSSCSQGNDMSLWLSISADGKYMAFTSFATNLVSGDTNGHCDVFINNVDFTSPTVNTIDPKNGAKGIFRNKNITVTFSENIKIANASKIVLKNASGAIVATGKSISGNKLILTHSKFSASTRYYIYIYAGAIADYTDNPNLNTANYQYYFTTTELPTVKTIDPKNGATGVSRSKTITLTFNKNIKIAKTSKIVLRKASGAIVATGKSAKGNKLILTHSKLSANTKYYIYIYAGAIADYTDNTNLNTANYRYFYTTGRY